MSQGLTAVEYLYPVAFGRTEATLTNLLISARIVADSCQDLVMARFMADAVACAEESLSKIRADVDAANQAGREEFERLCAELRK